MLSCFRNQFGSGMVKKSNKLKLCSQNIKILSQFSIGYFTEAFPTKFCMYFLLCPCKPHF